MRRRFRWASLRLPFYKPKKKALRRARKVERSWECPLEPKGQAVVASERSVRKSTWPWILKLRLSTTKTRWRTGEKHETIQIPLELTALRVWLDNRDGGHRRR